MGGDNAPDAIVAGARIAAAAGTPVVLVGPADLGDRCDLGGIPLVVATEVIEMDEDGGRAVRRKKDSTLVRAAELVRDGEASAMLSAGNTGATMASALLRMGTDSWREPACDCNDHPSSRWPANRVARCRGQRRGAAEWLVQFAQMGSVLARHRFGLASPKVGLLSIGEEPGKGDTLRKETYPLLLAAAAAGDLTSSATSRVAT